MARWTLNKSSSTHSRIKRAVTGALFTIKRLIRGILFTLRSSKDIYKMHVVLTEAEPYIIAGEAIDQDWIYKNREELEKHIVEEMRKDGFIPVLDMSPGLKTLNYNESKESFEYEIEFKAFKVGLPKSNEYMGVLVQQGILIHADATAVSIAQL